jgi:hypothetical protein
MRRITLFTVAAALIVVGIGTWSVIENHARAATTGVDPLGMMTSAQNLPTSQYDDYSVVFN